jgi:DNA-binding IclR family transcriptional regulator
MRSFNIVVADRHETLAGNAKLSGPDDRRSVSRSATRALDILELIGEARAPLRAVDIARSLQLHASTVDQLLKTMVDSSHLMFDARRKTYAASPRLLRFSTHVLESYFGDDRIYRLLDAVHAGTGGLVTLATPRDLSMQVVEALAPQGCDYPHQRGMRVPMFGSATGAAYLSTLSRPEISILVARARLQPAFCQPLLEGVRRIRAQGYAFGGLSDEADPRSIAIPLPMAPDQTPLVIGFTGERVQLELEKDGIVRLVRQSIYRWIGGSPVAD